MIKPMICCFLLAPAVLAADKPNIIFILTDDQGYGDCGRHGHPYLNTPNLDRLHDQSVRFDNFYVSPSCSPTRAALLTGMHEFRNGVTHTLQPREHLYLEAVIIPQLLKAAGYKTGFIGKWHLSDQPGYGPRERGFDWCSSNVKGPHRHFDPEMIRNGVRTQRKGFREDIYFDEAMTFIDESGDQPFFLYLCTYSPHTPLDAPGDLIEKYSRMGLNDTHATYLAMIENIDQNLGRLADFLEKRDLAEKTVVIFMNDNGVTEGLDVYNAGMRGCKCTAWHGGVRAMSFWHWPEHWKPRRVDSLTAHLDVLPTLCELAGAAIPEQLRPDLEGFSLVPLLNGSDWAHNDRFLFHNVGRWPSGTAASHQYAMCGVRKDHWLLMRSADCGDPECEKYQSQCTTMRSVRQGLTTTTYAKGSAQYHWGVTPPGRWVLFDIHKDPGCRNDLSKANPELVAEMIAAYDRWWMDTYPVMIERGGDEGDAGAIDRQRAAFFKRAAGVEAERRAVVKPAADTAGRQSNVFIRMDADGDNRVTREEYLGLFVPTFPDKDTDRDGKLAPEEFPYEGSFKVGDADADGYLTPAEFEGMYSHQFESRDRNRDGFVTVDEM